MTKIRTGRRANFPTSSPLTPVKHCLEPVIAGQRPASAEGPPTGVSAGQGPF